MECLAELYTINRQPGKALPYYLRLRKPNVFELIKENNLFPDVKDQVLLLVEFDHELMEKNKKTKEQAVKKEFGKETKDDVKSEAIALLVNNIHSIPVRFIFCHLYCILIESLGHSSRPAIATAAVLPLPVP